MHSRDGKSGQAPRLRARLRTLGVALLLSLAGIAAPAHAQLTLGDGPGLDDGDLSLGRHVVYLGQGDRLRGSLVKLEGDQIYWGRPDLSTPAVFSMDTILRIASSARHEVSEDATTVVLSNGDRVPGRLVRIDSETLVMDTDFAGTLTIPRRSVARIRTARANDDGGLFVGRTLEDSFRTVSGDWTLSPEGELTGRGGVIFHYPVPTRTRISVDVSWTTDKPAFSIISHVSNTTYHHYGYNIFMNGERLQLTRGTRYEFGSIGIDEFSDKQVHMDIEVDQQQGAVTVFLNGRKIESWHTHYNPNQNFIAFASNGETTTFQNLHVTPLDEADAAISEVDSDRAGFGDDDRLSGQIVSLDDGMVLLTTAYGDLQIPLAELSEMEFRSSEQIRARREARDIRLHFPNGGRLTTAVQSIADSSLIGYSENTGEITLDLSYVNRIDFHLYRPQADDEEDDLGMNSPPGRGVMPHRVPNIQRIQNGIIID